MFDTLKLSRAGRQSPVLAVYVLALTLVAPWVLGQDADRITEIRRQAEQGDAVAQYNLGLMYDFGDGVPENDAEAVNWYRLAAEQGHADAQYDLGFMYDVGLGVPEDYAEAVKWYRLAADTGGRWPNTPRTRMSTARGYRKTMPKR